MKLPNIPSLLPVRLPHRRPGLVVPLLFGIALGGVAYGAWEAWSAFQGESIMWVFLTVAVLCGLFSTLLLWSGFYQCLLRRTPITVLEISKQPFRIGQTGQIAIIQPGPARLRYLRVDLICLARRTTWHRRMKDSNGQRDYYTTVETERLSTETVIDEKEIEASSGDLWKVIREFDLPNATKPSFDSSDDDTDDEDDTPLEGRVDTAIVWQVELTGKAGPLSGFRHVFEVKVALS